MSNTLTLLADAIANYLLIGSVIAGITVPLAWGIIKVARIRTPVYRHMIWSYLLIGVTVLPAIWLYAPKLTLAVLPAKIEPLKVASFEKAHLDSGFIPVEERLPQAHSPEMAYAETPVEDNMSTRVFTVKSALCGVWFVGFVFLLARLTIGWHRLREICQMATLLPPSDRQTLTGGRPTIHLTSELQGPVCFGVFRPMILLPQHMYENCTPESLQMILCHELAHIERRDCWANLFQRIIESLFFFHLLVWFASRRLTQEREQICDNHVLAEGISADDYTTLLSQIGEQAVHFRYLQTVALFEGQLLSRIRSLLDPLTSRQTKISWRVAVVSTVVVLATLLTVGSVRLAAKPSVDAISENITPLSTAEVEAEASDKDQKELKKSLHQAAENGDIELIKKLIAKGVDVNAAVKVGSGQQVEVTPLINAASGGHTQVVKLLLEHGAEVDATCSFGYTALYYAIWSAGINDVEGTIKVLIANGADVNKYPQEDGYSPLIHAIWMFQEKEDIVKALLDAGANIDFKDKDGLTPLFWAAFSSGKDVLDLILARGNYDNTIHLAACRGNLSRVKEFVEEGTDVNIRDEFGCTPLHWAALAESTEVADFLIDKGADVNAKGAVDITPLLAARGFPMIKLLVSRGADIQAQRRFQRMTKLHMVCTEKDKDVVEFLINKGAQVDRKNRRGQTPLWLAASCGRKEIVELLIKKGADINVSNNQGLTLLTMAKQQKHTEVVNILRQHGAKETLYGAAASGDIDEIKRLLSQGTDVNVTNEEGQTPLHKAARAGQSNVAELLISRGANINATSKAWESTPLHCTANKGRANVAELLLAKGAKLELRNFNGQTPLHLTAFSNQPKVAGLLLAHGADIEARTTYDRTPLGAALNHDHAEMVEFLLDKGANIRAKEVGMPLLNVAIRDNNKEMVTLLMKKGLALPPIHQAVFLGELDKVKTHIDKGVNIDLKDTGGFTPLFCAICGHHKEIVGLLLDKGADVNTQAANGRFPLGYAKIDIARLLVAKGANVKLKDKTGQTVLHWAVNRNDYQGDLELVKLYLSRGADVNAKAYSNSIRWEGWTPFHVACRNGNKAIVELLISNGANINAKTDKGLTPLSLAEEKGRTDVVELLRKHGAKEL